MNASRRHYVGLFMFSLQFDQKSFLRTGYLGLLGAIFVGIGEFLLHYSSIGYDFELPYGFFQEVSRTRLVWGQILVVGFFPLYFVGYLHLSKGISVGSMKMARVLFILGVWAFSIGGVWVGSRAFMGGIYHALVMEQSDNDAYLAVVPYYELLVESLVKVLRVFVFLISIVYSYAILKYQTIYPKWVALFSPIVVLIIVFALFFGWPLVGDFLAPTAMNFAHVVVFGMSLHGAKINNKD